jgi:hypothetical protein
MDREILIGISGGGVLHTDAHVPDVDTQFRMVRDAGVFDYFERTPLPGLLDTYRKASAATGVPLLSGGFFYALGRDEPLLEWHLRIGAECGMRVQNVQVPFRDAKGERVTNQQVADFYLWAAELGDRLGVTPCFEVHINMWSERLSRVAQVARLVEARGVKFNMTLDHSHVIFKIGNEGELPIEGLREDLAGGLVLDPTQPGNVCAEWIANNWVRHAHARPAVPNNPRNVWAAHPDGSPGRGVQYPFVQPKPGEWHSDWNVEKLEPWKEVVRQMFAHHAHDPRSRLQQVTVEMIPGIDYGFGHRYSIFDHSVEVAKWLRAAWQAAKTGAA